MKHGQAALDFLLTYGWAILVVLTAVSVLAYFDLLPPMVFDDELDICMEYECACTNSMEREDYWLVENATRTIKIDGVEHIIIDRRSVVS